jgi:hypothetical protein
MDPVGGASTHLLRDLQAGKGLTEEIRNLKEMNVTQGRQIWRLNSENEEAAAELEWKRLSAEKDKDTVERQALQIKNLESIICRLNRQNEEAATDPEWERLSTEKDKDTVERQALQIKNLESIIYHLNIQNEESAEELELLRKRAKKDEATILR